MCAYNDMVEHSGVASRTEADRQQVKYPRLHQYPRGPRMLWGRDPWSDLFAEKAGIQMR